MTIRPNVMERRLKLARALARNNGGKLPNPWKMIQQGHGGLYRYIQRHPDEFGHFEYEEAVGNEQKNLNKRGSFNVSIRHEHLSTALRLAKKGVIPDTGWLIQHGYTRLASYVKTYPHVFKNLEPAPKKKCLTHKRKKRRRY